MNIIETRDLTKYYGKSRGIVDLNLAVKSGEFFGFIGPNGAGKSTTIRALLGLITATSGEAKLFGKDAAREKTEILKHVGYMPSEAMFYSGMRVKEVIALSSKIRGEDCREEAKHLCERLQVDTEKRIEALSLGNRKKVSIVCALQHKPELYILDEPTSGLDPLMQRAFFQILEERNREGATIFLSSHVLSEIQRYCRRAAIIREGRLVTCDSVEVLSQTNAKRVTLHGVTTAPKISGVRDERQNENGVSFLYGGEMGALIGALAQMPVTDMTVTEPDLDEVFMHFYSEDGAQK